MTSAEMMGAMDKLAIAMSTSGFCWGLIFTVMTTARWAPTAKGRLSRRG